MEKAPESGKTIMNLKNIQSILLRDENLKSSKIQNSPPDICTDSSSSGNASSNVSLKVESETFSTQDEDLLDILVELQKPIKGAIGENDRLEGYFCSDTVFNLSNRVLSDSEIKLLEKGLDFAPIQRKINEPELRKDFNEFCRRMRIKWNFRNEPSQNFSETPAFRVKSSWKLSVT